MNILFLFYAPIVPYVGGVQRVTENLAVEFKKRGNNVYYLNIDSKQPDYGYLFPVPQLQIEYTTNKEKALENYLEILKKFKIDIIINQEARFDLLDILSYTPVNIKRITCIHRQPFYNQTYYREFIRGYNVPGIKAKLYKIICTLFPSIFFNSTLVAQQNLIHKTLMVSNYICLLSEYFIPRIKKYMPSINESRFIAINNPNTFLSSCEFNIRKKKQIIWVGRHENTPKNFPLFVNVWNKIVNVWPDWEAIVLGEGKDLEYNKHYAKAFSAKNLSFVGNQKDVSKYYKDASFLIVTSYSEGWGMVITEAMNYGCIPCVFDTYESIYDIIDNHVNGLIIPSFNIDMMVSEISILIKNNKAKDNMQSQCSIKSQQFNVETIVDKWESILKKI